jgi:alcohol dehydrogenase
MWEFTWSVPCLVKFGNGVSSQIVAEATRLAGDVDAQAFVVTDEGVRAAGLLKDLCRSLEDGGIGYSIFDQVEPNPRHTTVESAAERFRHDGANLIIAVGGGSVMDAAKGIGVVAKYGGRIADYDGVGLVPGPIPPFIALPTTAGTASEVTIWAVITDAENHVKMGVGDYKILPHVALVDPELTYTLPRTLTVGTGLDALTHAVEAYTCRRANPISDPLALRAMELVATHLPHAAADGSDPIAREGMSLASLIAGIAFSNAAVAAVHCLAETAGGLYDGPHGMLCGLFLPYVTAYNAPAETARHANMAAAMGADPRPEAAAQAFYDLAQELGVPHVSDFGVTGETLDEIAAGSAAHPETESNPQPIGKAEYGEIIAKTLAWERPRQIS